MPEANYSIKAVAKLTGLTPHVIRVWEKRYGAVKPQRTGTNRRLYSEEDIQRLEMLRHATSAGHSIGNIANLPEERLARLAVPHGSSGAVGLKGSGAPGDLTAEALSAIRDLNNQALEGVLERAVVALGQHGLLERVISPVVNQVGQLWRDGSLTAAHEHFATAVIRTFLSRNSRAYVHGSDMPSVVVTTPAGQLHELGAVMAAAAASDVGWRVVYLGPSLPASEIAGAALQNRSRLVALSIVYPADDSRLAGELEILRKYLPPEAKLVVGGQAAAAYGETLVRIGATQVRNLGEFYQFLQVVREVRP